MGVRLSSCKGSYSPRTVRGNDFDCSFTFVKSDAVPPTRAIRLVRSVLNCPSKFVHNTHNVHVGMHVAWSRRA